MLAQIHVRMLDYVQQHGGNIQIILFCPHHPDDNCECRKPKAGLYNELTDRLSINLVESYSVGDSLRDLIAAKSAGVTPVLVKSGNGRKTLKEIKKNRKSDDEQQSFDNIIVYGNLAKFVDALLSGNIK